MPKPTADKAYRGISPIREDGKVIAFLVRLRRGGKLLEQEYVSIAKKKGIEAAFDYSEKLRDKWEQKHPLLSKAETLSKPTKQNTTGVRGVAHCHSTHKRSGVVYESLQAQWPTIDGNGDWKKYSIGAVREYDEALELATQARKAGVKKYLHDLQSSWRRQ